MAQQIIEDNGQCAEVYTCHDECNKEIIEILKELHLPGGVLPLKDMEEVGYNRTTGFVWLKQKKEITHNFKKIGKSVWYGKEITVYVEEKKMVRITGVKGKELLLFISITEMAIADSQGKKLTFNTPIGMKKTFPASAFELEQA